MWSFPGPAETYENSFRRVERDPRDAHASRYLDTMRDRSAAEARKTPPPAPGAPSREQRAATLSQAAAKLEQEALAKWDSIRDLRYTQVRELIADDPMAKLAWQTLLITGKLDKTAEPAHDGKPLYDHIVALSRQPLAPGLDRKTLLADLIQEIAEPACIAQHMRSTRTVTSAQIMLAADRPAEYARIVAGLAGPGAVATLGGGVLVRDDADPAKCGRTQSSALFQAACMELGNGEFDYDDAKDQSGPASTVIKGYARGLGPEEVPIVLEALTGSKWLFAKSDTSGQGGLMAWGSQEGAAPPAVTLAAIKAITAKQRPVVAAVTWADDLKDPRAPLSGHALLVTGVREGRVYYCNPYGAEESMSEADFLARVRGFYHDPRD